MANISTLLDAMEYVSDALVQATYISTGTVVTPITGGTITRNRYKAIHTFTSSGTFHIPAGLSGNVDVLVIAGGGGGGKAETNNYGDGGGGGGAGGFRKETSFSVSEGDITVTVGSGGTGSTALNVKGGNGQNSVFGSITAIGGGGGGSDNSDINGINKGADGGSGGGAASYATGVPATESATEGGSGTTGQGYDGGGSNSGLSSRGGGGGGGAGGAGSRATSNTGANGGPGLADSISGSSVTYAVGGKGGNQTSSTGAVGATGAANTGNGGGGGNSSGGNGGPGGSGIVIVSYDIGTFGSQLSILPQTDSSNVVQGSYALKITALQTLSLNNTLTKTFRFPVNLSYITNFSGSIKASRTGANVKIGLHDSGGTVTEITPNIAQSNVYQTFDLDISGVSNANKDVIDQIIITITNADADNIIYLDNLYVYIPAREGAWLSGFKYRKTITASRSAGFVTNYPMRFSMGLSPYNSGDISVVGAKSDFSDIRVTKADGTTLLPYWIETIDNVTPTTKAYIWINFDYIPAGGELFYVYWGKSDATSLSDGSTVFDFFDDFNSGSLDSSKWDLVQGDFGFANGRLNLTGNAATRGLMTGKSASAIGHGLVFRGKSDTNGILGAAHVALRDDANDNCVDFGGNGTTANSTLVITKSGGNTTTSAAISTPTLANDHTYLLGWQSGSFYLYQDGTQIATGSTNIPTSDLKPSFYESDNALYNAFFDFVAIANWSSTAPSIVIGNQEKAIVSQTELIDLNNAVKFLFHMDEPLDSLSVSDSSLYARGYYSWGTTDKVIQNNTKFAGLYYDTIPPKYSDVQKKFGNTSVRMDGPHRNALKWTPGDRGELQFKDRDFTVEFFVMRTGYSGYRQYFANQSYAENSNTQWCILGTDTATIFYWSYAITGSYSISGPAVVMNTWHHIAISRTANILRFFMDGVLCGSADIGTNSLYSTGYDLQFGGTTTGGSTYQFFLDGYMDEMRISSISRYTSDSFSVPTQAFEWDDDTVFLCHCEGPVGTSSFYDEAGICQSLFGIDRAWVSLTGMSNGIEIGDSAEWAFGTNPFTYELWMQLIDGRGYRYLFCQQYDGTHNHYLYYNKNVGGFVYVLNGSMIGFWPYTIVIRKWYHVALVRSNRNVVTLYVNGEAIQTIITDYSVPDIQGGWDLGTQSYGMSVRFEGYMRDVKLTTGYAVYQSNFSVPTTPQSSEPPDYLCVDPEYGDNANPGTSWDLPLKSLSGAKIRNGLPEVRIKKSSDPVSLGNGWWEYFENRIYIDNSTMIKTLDRLIWGWTAAANITTAIQTDCKDAMTGVYIYFGSGFTTGKVIYKAFSTPQDFSNYTGVTLWLRKQDSYMENGLFKFCLCSDTAGDVIVNELYLYGVSSGVGTNQWNPFYADAGVPLGTNIQSMALYAMWNPGTPVYRMGTITLTNGINLLSLISTNPNAQGGDVGWNPIKKLESGGQTLLLLNFEGADLSTTPRDESNYQRSGWFSGTIARVSTANYKFGSSSLYLNGSSGYFGIDSCWELNFNDEAFTIECFFKTDTIPGTGSYRGLLSKRYAWNQKQAWALTQLEADFGFEFTWTLDLATQEGFSFGGAGETSNWHHVAVCRQGDYIYGCIDGVIDKRYIGRKSFANSDQYLSIGKLDNAGGYFNGYIDSVRIKKGPIAYSTNNDSLVQKTDIWLNAKLALQFIGENNSTNIVDTSPFNKPITLVGNPIISTSKFKFGTSSGYFDGSSYLTVPNSNDFIWSDSNRAASAECWFYTTTVTGTQTLFNKSGKANVSYPNWQLYLVDNKLKFALGFARTSSSSLLSDTSGNTVLQTNTWYHAAIVKSGSNYYVFLNGVIEITVTGQTGGDTRLAPLMIGGDDSGNYFHGYLADVRIVKNDSGYPTSGFTPNTATFRKIWDTYTVPTQAFTADDGIVVTLDCDNWNTYSTIRTEQETGIQETFYRNAFYAVASTDLTIPISGLVNALATFRGGFNPDTDVQDGESYFDFNGRVGNGLDLNSKSYVFCEKINVSRGNYNYTLSGSNNKVFATNAAGAATDGVVVSGTNIEAAIDFLMHNSAVALRLSGKGLNVKVKTIVQGSYGIYVNCYGSKIHFDWIFWATYGLSSGPGGMNQVSGGLIQTVNGTGIYLYQNNEETIFYNLETKDNTVIPIRVDQLGSSYIRNLIVNESNLLTFNQTSPVTKLSIDKFNGDLNDNRTYSALGYWRSQNTVRHTTSGIAWQLCPTSANCNAYMPLRMPLIIVAVLGNTTTNVSVWVRRSDTGVTAQLVCPAFQLSGLEVDAVATAIGIKDTWEQLSISFTPAESGIVKIELWVYGGTTYSAYVDDVTIG